MGGGIRFGVQILAGQFDGEGLAGGVALGPVEGAPQGGEGDAVAVAVHPADGGRPLSFLGESRINFLLC